MKTKFLFVLISMVLFTGCTPDDEQEDDILIGNGQQGIYVKFTSESRILSFSDDNPCTPNNVVEGIAYGACATGTFRAHAILANGMEFPNVPYQLHNPASGFKIRTYNYRFYYDSNLNRWLFSPTFVDSN